MTCEEFSELVWSYPFEGMDDEKIKEIEQHCSECENCNKQLQEVKELTNMLRALPKIEPPEGFAANIIEQIEAMPKIGRYQRIAAICRKYYTAAAAACLAIVSLTAIDVDMLYPKAENATSTQIVITEENAATEAPETVVSQILPENTQTQSSPVLPTSTVVPDNTDTTETPATAVPKTAVIQNARPTTTPQNVRPTQAVQTAKPVTQEATVQTQEVKEETPAPQITQEPAKQTVVPQKQEEEINPNNGIAVASIDMDIEKAVEETPQTEAPIEIDESQYVIDEAAISTQTADISNQNVKMGEEPQKPQKRIMPADKASKIAMIDIKDKDEGKVKLLLDQMDTTKESGYYYLTADDYEIFISELKMENINHIRSIEMANPASDLVALQIMVS